MGKGLEGGHLGYVTQLIYINFLVLILPEIFIWTVVSNHPSVSEKKIEIWVTFGQGQIMTLTFGTHLTSLTLVDCFD